MTRRGAGEGKGGWRLLCSASLTDTPFKLDAAKAKPLLAGAGVPQGFTVKLDHADVAPFMDIAQSAQATMGRAGIKVELVTADSKQVITKYRARNHELVCSTGRGTTRDGRDAGRDEPPLVAAGVRRPGRAARPRSRALLLAGQAVTRALPAAAPDARRCIVLGA